MAIKYEAKKLFRKHFYFRLKDLKLPPAESLFISDPWSIPTLMEMKEDLNRIKCLLDDKDITDWRRHTKHTNQAGNISSEVKYRIKPEMLTQAWLKFYEIVSKFPLVPKKLEETLYTFHLCEAPGAFIAALNHYLVRKNQKKKWEWKANTLNPYYEGNSSTSAILDDDFIIDTLSNWKFGKDNTGNIMDPKYLEDLKEYNGKMHLVTADGSINCQGDPSEQERTVAALHYCETVIALHLLTEGGCLVIKMFTMFEMESLCKLFLLNCVFEKVCVFKPATSKSGNSEVYVVCLHFKGQKRIGAKFLHALRQHLGQNSSKAMFPKEYLNESFLTQVLKCTKKFKDYQKKTIQRNLDTFGQQKHIWNDKKYIIENIKRECAKLYIQRYDLQKIKSENFIRGYQYSAPKNFKWTNSEIQKLEYDLRGGSLNERRAREEEGLHAQITFLKECFSSLQINENGSMDFTTKPLKFSKCIESWIVKGRPYEHVINSKFCFPCIIEAWNEVIHYKEISEVRFCAIKEEDWKWDKLKNNRIYESLQNSVLVCIGETEMPELGSIMKELNSDRKIITINNKDESYNKKKFIFIGLPSSDITNQEMNTRMILIKKIGEMLKILQERDCLMLSLQGVLTRFTVGIIYFLCILFQKMVVINPKENASPLANQVWLFLHADLKYLKDIQEHLNYNASQMKCDEAETVLEIIPMKYLCEDRFCSYLLRNNEALIVHKLRYVLNCLEELQNQKRLTIKSDYRSLEQRFNCI